MVMERLFPILRPICFLFLATILFTIGICQSYHPRSICACLYILAALFCFGSLHDFPAELVTFYLGWMVHTSGILLLGETSPRRFSSSLVHEFKTIFFLWTNFRGMKPFNNGITPNNSTFGPRFSFAMRRVLRTLGLLALNHGMTELLIKPTLASLGIIRADFSLAKQGLVPPTGRTDLILRLIISTLWIWKTYFILTVSHDVSAVLFVSVLQWNDMSEWPPLFGSILDAVSISEFWGSFWHRLHVLPYLRFQPSISSLGYCPPWIRKSAVARNGFRAFWVFLCSAVCHVALNHVVYGRLYLKAELRFFLCNWCVCLGEKMLKRAKMGGEGYSNVNTRAQNGAVGLVSRIGGYTFVLGFFFCTVPAWRYPLIFDSIPGIG